jgi:hypothetical protein
VSFSLASKYLGDGADFVPQQALVAVQSAETGAAAYFVAAPGTGGVFKAALDAGGIAKQIGEQVSQAGVWGWEGVNANPRGRRPVGGHA